jgi:hypothetical protein
LTDGHEVAVDEYVDDIDLEDRDFTTSTKADVGPNATVDQVLACEEVTGQLDQRIRT